jgi:hypothetical protein
MKMNFLKTSPDYFLVFLEVHLQSEKSYEDSGMHPGRIEFHKVPWPGDRRGMWSLWCTGLLTRFLMRLSGGHGIFHKSQAPPTTTLVGFWMRIHDQRHFGRVNNKGS